MIQNETWLFIAFAIVRFGDVNVHIIAVSVFCHHYFRGSQGLVFSFEYILEVILLGHLTGCQEAIIRLSHLGSVLIRNDNSTKAVSFNQAFHHSNRFIMFLLEILCKLTRSWGSQIWSSFPNTRWTIWVGFGSSLFSAVSSLPWRQICCIITDEAMNEILELFQIKLAVAIFVKFRQQGSPQFSFSFDVVPRYLLIFHLLRNKSSEFIGIDIAISTLV